MGFGSLGISELLVIFVVVLVFFGPKRMPEVARSMGSAMREFRRSLNQIQRELEEADPTSELRKETRSILSQLPEQVRPAMAGDGSPQRTTEARGAAAREAAPPPGRGVEFRTGAPAGAGIGARGRAIVRPA